MIKSNDTYKTTQDELYRRIHEESRKRWGGNIVEADFDTSSPNRYRINNQVSADRFNQTISKKYMLKTGGLHAHM